MKRIAFIIVALLGIVSLYASGQTDSTHAVLMKEVFADMPQSIVPLVTRNNRLDCIDMIENNMEARVRNAIDEHITLEALNRTYLRLRTSNSYVLEMKLLPYEGTYLIAIVRTANLGNEDDSIVSFYSIDWNELDASTFYTAPGIEDFLDNIELSDTIAQAKRELTDRLPMEITLAPDANELSIRIQWHHLDRDMHGLMQQILKPITLIWNGKQFIPFV